MIQTIFGDLEYGDEEALDDWVGAHAQGHDTILQALRQYGAFPQYTLLRDRVDNDWLGRHALTHIAIARTLINITSESSGLLNASVDTWENRQSFYDWHANHDAIHQRINTALNISAQGA